MAGLSLSDFQEKIDRRQRLRELTNTILCNALKNCGHVLRKDVATVAEEVVSLAKNIEIRERLT